MSNQTATAQKQSASAVKYAARSASAEGPSSPLSYPAASPTLTLGAPSSRPEVFTSALSADAAVPIPSAVSPLVGEGSGPRRRRGRAEGPRGGGASPSNAALNTSGGTHSSTARSQGANRSKQSNVTTARLAARLRGAAGGHTSADGASTTSSSSYASSVPTPSDSCATSASSSSSSVGSDEDSVNSDAEAAEELTYTELLARGIDDALRHFGADTAKELISIVADRRVAVTAQYALYTEALLAGGGAGKRRKGEGANGEGAHPDGKGEAAEGGSTGDATAPPAHFSVRQLASWKVAMQKTKDRRVRRQDATAVDEGDTFFTTMPLQYNDFADAHVTTQVYATPKQRREDRLIHFMQRYYIWVTLLFTVMHILYFSMVTFRCGFGVPYDAVDYAIEWIVLDIPMGLFAFITDILPREYKGVYKVQLGVEARKYLTSSSFVSDVLGFIPLDIVGFALDSRCSLTNPSMCGFLAPYWKLNRILLARYAAFNTGDLMEAVTLSTGYPPQVARLTLFLMYLLLIAHTAACVFNIFIETNPSLCRRWLDDPIYLERSLSDRYLQALDWSTKSLLSLWRGFNFNLPLEVIVFVLVLALIGTVIFSSFIGIITSLLFRNSPYEVTTTEINLLYDECSHKGLPNDLRDQAREYYWHLYRTTGKKDVIMDALEGLPKSLQVRLTLQVGRDMLGKVPLLAPEAHNNEFVLALTVALVPQVVHPFTVLFKKGDRGDSMAFVTDGSVAVVPPTFVTTLDVTNIYFLLKTGSFFGEIALILGIPRTATIATLARFANLLVLTEDNFRQIAADFPSAVRRMRLEAECRLAALNQGPEALTRERARRLLDAINTNRMRYAFGKWMRGCQQKMMDAALGVVMGSGAVIGVTPQQTNLHVTSSAGGTVLLSPVFGVGEGGDTVVEGAADADAYSSEDDGA